MRKTKIVCTLGLVSNTQKVIEQLMDTGMNVARFNFSHGNHESHKQTLDIVKKLRKSKNIPIATLLDTKGPEIRLGKFKEGFTILEPGKEFILTAETVEGSNKKSSISYKELYKDVSVGDMILIDDGLIELKVTKIKDKDIYCQTINGGRISDRKGVNIPGVDTSMPYIGEADKLDIKFGVDNGFDFIAASFVRDAKDAKELRELINSHGGQKIGIIAKIENAAGVANIDEILDSVEGIMVARGDMGVEVPLEDLPALQKSLIRKCYRAGKMVITATQMLESMINNPRPTRAEISDVANAVYDGTSAVMLSGETAAGKYPVETVKTMAKIVERAEQDVDYERRFHTIAVSIDSKSITNAISHATCTTAYDLKAEAVITVTISGRTARNISKFRPSTPIFGCTTSYITYNQLALSWGVIPIMIDMQQDLDELLNTAVDEILEKGYIRNGSLVVITTGVPLGVAGTTNLMKVHVAGDVIVSGTGINDKSVSGRICVIKQEDSLEKYFNDGDILIINQTNNEMMPILRKAKGIVCEEDGLQSHAAIVGLTLDIPVIVGAINATNLLHTGTHVFLDAHLGIVSSGS